MDTLSFKTISANKATVNKEWVIVDAEGQTLGRLCAKWNDRIYLRYTGYPGGQIAYTPADLQAKGDDRLFRKVVKGMLPKNRLGAKLLNNLYVYAGTEHKHEAQQPKLIDINSYK